MNAKTFCLRDPLEKNELLAAFEEARHSLFVAEALAAGLTPTEIADGYKVGVAVGGTTDQLVEFFRRLADLQQYGFYAVRYDAVTDEEGGPVVWGLFHPQHRSGEEPLAIERDPEVGLGGLVSWLLTNR